MSRLIDADKLDSYIKEKLGGNKAEYELFATMIDNQPTAFDIEETLEKLDTWQRQSGDGLIAVGVAIDFVKGAVKE